MADIFDDLVVEEIPAVETGEGASFEERYASFINNDVYNKAVELHTSATVDMDAADQRFSTAINLNQLRNLSVAIIGCGGLGNWQWRILLGMGIKNIHVFDDDTVGIENIGPQAHSILDLGLPKVEAVRRAALQYRGVSISTHNHKVYTLTDVVNAIGYVPDVIIGCTDSAEFRNGFIPTIISKPLLRNSTPNTLPKLWLDYRMTMGNWICYAYPVRSMSNILRSQQNAHIKQCINIAIEDYHEEAIFPPEEAELEPCTARAICYTGANVASYTGAYIHWFLTTGHTLFNPQVAEEDYRAAVAEQLKSYFRPEDTRPDTELPKFYARFSHSAMDCENISDGRRELMLRRTIRKLRERSNPVLDFLEVGLHVHLSMYGLRFMEESLMRRDLSNEEAMGKLGLVFCTKGRICLAVFTQAPDGRYGAVWLEEGSFRFVPAEYNSYVMLQPIEGTDFHRHIAYNLFGKRIGTQYIHVGSEDKAEYAMQATINSDDKVTIECYHGRELINTISTYAEIHHLLEYDPCLSICRHTSWYYSDSYVDDFNSTIRGWHPIETMYTHPMGTGLISVELRSRLLEAAGAAEARAESTATEEGTAPDLPLEVIINPRAGAVVYFQDGASMEGPFEIVEVSTTAYRMRPIDGGDDSVFFVQKDMSLLTEVIRTAAAE